MNTPIYMDNHATTKMDPRVLKAMMPYLTERFGNPSSIDHPQGYEASVAIEDARSQVAALVGARHDEIIFTSGATEADNMALVGAMAQYNTKGDKIITSKIEHKAVLDTVEHLKQMGKKVVYLPVDNTGIIHADTIQDAITPDTVMISVMVANNEIGTIQNIQHIGDIARQNDILFHTDAAQAVGHIPINVQKMNIDIMSISAHKMYGPKGVGALYIRSIKPTVRIQSIIRGGGQEHGIRSGTHNVAGIVGFGKAAELAQRHMKSEAEQQRHYTDIMLKKFRKAGAELNGHAVQRLPHNLNVRFSGIEGKAIINSVSDSVAISSGSACTTQAVEPSHVLLATGLSEDEAHESIRFGLGRFNTKSDIDIATDHILEAVDDLKRFTTMY